MRNKKLAAGIGGVTAVAAAAAISMGTYAAFSDSEERGVIATGGTMDLVVSNTYGDVFGEDGFVTVGEVVPGQTVGSTTFTLQNAGSVDGNLSLDFEKVYDQENGYTGPEGEIDSSSDEGELLENLKLKVEGGPNGTYTLSNLADIESYDLGTLAGEDSNTYTLTLLVADAGNEIQGDSAKFKIQANLVQVQG